MPEAAACLARCALFVGNDSGLMHLAASSGAATLGLFGPTPVQEYAPAGPRAGNCRFRSGCMKDLSVEAAMTAASPLIAAVEAA